MMKGSESFLVLPQLSSLILVRRLGCKIHKIGKGLRSEMRVLPWCADRQGRFWLKCCLKISLLHVFLLPDKINFSASKNK